ncbi:MAG: tetratricopeptide repeat protein [Acidobacteria bacterium]|uniref:Tetratricopeptide repeat protein n=1 Tax=Candidatus Polarisedimenticola svalbardensis TaxID=2886004 RepID=A0A8J6Y162_9BACT|nr:tetratricopeptide repeat protein [Candidatus Polarisedimenticola svalbardensis]
MNIRSLPFWIGLVLVALFGIRAVTGVMGGVAYAFGSAAAAQGYYDTALPHLEKAAVGINRYETLWLEAEVRIGLYDMLQQVPDSDEEQTMLLEQALDGYRAAATSCPVSGWSWQGMSEVYFRLEERRRAGETPDLALLSRPAWDRVGEEGRTAFGFLRWAIDKEAGVYTFRDRLVTRSIQYGLDEDAAVALADTAVQQPDFWQHADLQTLDDPDMLRQFAQSSEGALEDAPLITRERHLFSLGKLYHRLGDLVRAESLFRSAREEPSTALHAAEVAFHLALVLKEQQRYDDALLFFEEAALSEAFQFAVYSNRAEIASSRGEWEVAFDYLNRCRRMAPRSTRFALAFAKAAERVERTEAAEQSLKWAALIDPKNTAVWSDLVDFYLKSGDLAAVRTTLRDAGDELGPDNPELLQLSGKLAARITARETAR